MKRTLGAAFLAFAGIPAAIAGLQFENKIVEVHADPGSEKVTAKFEFKNTGTVKEKIKIQTHCGCLSATADHTMLEPGQPGTITAVFNVKGKSGAFGKGLSVTSSGATRQTTELEVHVFIPQVVSLEPNTVVWKVGDKPTPKTIRVEMNHASPIRVLKLESSRPVVAASLTTIKEGKSYEIKLTPQSTASTVLGVVRLDTDCSIPEQRRQLAFFRIEK